MVILELVCTVESIRSQVSCVKLIDSIGSLYKLKFIS